MNPHNLDSRARAMREKEREIREMAIIIGTLNAHVLLLSLKAQPIHTLLY